MDLHSLQYFSKKYVNFEKINSFFLTDACFYLEKVYGKLIFTENKNVNFIGVYKNENKFLLSEDIFCKNSFNLEQVGNIIPASLNDLNNLEYFNTSKEGHGLKHKGYAKSASNRCTSGKKVTEDLRRKINALNFIKFSESNSYQSPKEYIDYLNSNEDNITIDSLSIINDLIFEKIKSNFNNNLISNYCIAETRVQKMTQGDSLVRHFGASYNEPYLFTALNYLTTGEFKGRNLYGGERTLNDLNRYVFDFTFVDNFNPYNDPVLEYEDTYSFKPSQQETLYVNATNPMFYHAVDEHISGAEVYAIITDIRLKP